MRKSEVQFKFNSLNHGLYCYGNLVVCKQVKTQIKKTKSYKSWTLSFRDNVMGHTLVIKEGNRRKNIDWTEMGRIKEKEKEKKGRKKSKRGDVTI